jgi:hypothetical protein
MRGSKLVVESPNFGTVQVNQQFNNFPDRNFPQTLCLAFVKSIRCCLIEIIYIFVLKVMTWFLSQHCHLGVKTFGIVSYRSFDERVVSLGHVVVS